MALNVPNIDPDAAAQLVGTVIGGDAAANPELYLIVAGTVLARIIGFMMVAPFFGSMNIPMTVRVALSVVLTAVTVPFVQGDIAPGLAKELAGGGSLDYLLLLANQVLIGLMLGFCASFVTYAVESAGRILDTQRGSNMSDIVAPQTGERTSPSGQFLMMVALMILTVSGLHMMMLEGFLGTFRVFPPTIGLEWLGDPLHAGAGHPELTATIGAFAEMSGNSLMLTLQIAAPAMITLMLTDVLLGIINRGAPQVNVFALSQVVKGPIGIAALMIALLPTWAYLQDHAMPNIVTGKHSITAMAEKMDAADRAAKGR